MNRNLIWRGLAVLVVVVGCILLAYPPEKKINLGLDLRGGVHLVLDVQADEALRAETDKDMDTLVRQLGEEGVTGVQVRRLENSKFEATGVPAERRDAVEKVVDTYLPFWTYDRQPAGAWSSRASRRRTTTSAIRRCSQAQQTINNRIDAFGVAEPVIQRQGLNSSRIVVQLPGVDDPERVKELIKNTALPRVPLRRLPAAGRRGVGGRDPAALQRPAARRHRDLPAGE